MGLNTDNDGQIIPFTTDQIAAMGIEIVGIRDGVSPTHVRAVNSSTIQVEYRCLSESFDNGDFLAYMLGGSSLYGGDSTGAGQKLSRLMPQSFPGLPEFACTKLEDAHGYPISKKNNVEYLNLNAAGMPNYQKMTCRFTFEHVPFELASDAELLLGEELRYTQTLPADSDVNYLSMPSSVLKYLTPDGSGPNGVPLQAGVGFPVVTQTIRRKWIRLPDEAYGTASGIPTLLLSRIIGDPTTNARPFLGTVNSVPFLGYPRWTLLYLGIEEERTRDPLGMGYAWDLTHKWLFNPNTHLRFYYFETDPTKFGTTANGWYFAGRNTFYDQNGSTPLPDDAALFCERDHSQLFQVG